MYDKETKPLVTTIKEKCRVCYTCVRECPAKAIKVSGGQAQLITGKCIGCGNCVKVCSQGAKQFLISIPEVKELLASPHKVACIIAPSYPADFYDLDAEELVGMIRALGFDYVCEVAFGADLTAYKTFEYVNNCKNSRIISSSCPAVVEYIRCYHPELVENIAKVVSPMIATARVVHNLYGEDVKVVFVGPCIAKKGEACYDEVFGEVNEVLTFIELRQMFEEAGITKNNVQKSEFDPPLGGRGSVFPLSMGLQQTVGVYENLLEGSIVSAEGREAMIEAIKEFESGDLDTRLLELLCCNGCIMGAGMSSKEPRFRRRSRLTKAIKQNLRKRDEKVWFEYFNKYKNLDLMRTYTPNDQRIPIPSEEKIVEILKKLGKNSEKDELNCGACGYPTCRDHAIAIYWDLAESEMCLPYTIEKLHKLVKELEQSNEELNNTREALMQSEKLASMGQLSAGIAHELNNPLGVVLMYANLLLEEVDKNSQFYNDLKLICEEAERCKKITSGLLNFARQNKVQLKQTNIKNMIEQVLKINKYPENIKITTEYEDPNFSAEIDRDQIIQVLNNLINNAVTAMPNGGDLILKTGKKNGEFFISVTDTGIGIPESNMKRIFEPFFTTKQIGKGTGLGLAVSYGIVKMHKGRIDVKSNADPNVGPTGTTFTIYLPIKNENS